MNAQTLAEFATEQIAKQLTDPALKAASFKPSHHSSKTTSMANFAKTRKVYGFCPVKPIRGWSRLSVCVRL